MPIQVVLDCHPGPLPITGQFQPQGDVVPSIFFSGTAQEKAPNATCQVQVNIFDQDKKDAGFTTAVVMSNEPGQHKTLLALWVNQKPFAFGSTYTYLVQAAESSTVGDANDVYSLTILY